VPPTPTIAPMLVAELLVMEGVRWPVYVHLIDHPDARVLVDTGMTELHSAVADMDPYLHPLSEQNFDLAGIDIVVNTHLHFDHCGWNTRRVVDRIVPTFPNARYIVQKGELEHALHPTERDRASFISDNFVPVEASGQWWLLDGDREIAPGVELIRVPGHTRDMQCVRLSGGGKTAFFFADLVPTVAHLPYAWIMGFDLYPLTTLENKKRWIPEVARQGSLAFFAHDTKVRAALLREREGQYEAEPVEVEG
jgi:glyoxylase-like metal-dependent hydrolase (beta-lactamase superfamily II)